ncbi:transcriptional regulator, TetR family protein [Verrucomicrobiia bacterium DG1235]|nr:transcriptional regulator, TetR family protein [Verrucomicrobiae bacterium DG1235]
MRTVDPELASERRRQILDAALICFREKGFHGAAMSAICKQAGMSPGHLYHYFSGKEDLIQAIVEEDTRLYEEKLSSLVGEGNTLEMMLSRIDEIWSPEKGLHAALNAEILAEASRNPRISEIIRKHDESLRAKFASTIRTAQKRGHINADLDADGFSILVIAIVNGLRMADEAGDYLDRKQATAAFKQMLIASLEPREK